MSATIVPFLREASFDPGMVKAMSDAYDKARRELHDRGQPHIVNEIIATRIIEVARHGERNPDRLCEQALAALGVKR